MHSFLRKPKGPYLAVAIILMSGATIILISYLCNTDIIRVGSSFAKSNSTWKDFADVYAYLLSPIIGMLGFVGIILSIQSQESSSNKELTYSYLVELIKIYCGIRNDISINGKTGVYAFSDLLSEYFNIYNLIAKNNDLASDMSTAELVDMSFIFFYFGTNDKSTFYFEGFPKIKEISDQISRQVYKDDNGNIHKVHKGHQDILGHYFRFLYNAFGFIQDSEHISETEKMNLGKLLRSSISTYELGLIAINCKSKLGSTWIKTGKVNYFNLFTNIPKFFFVKNETGFTIEELYPDMKYDWKEQPSQSLGGALNHIG